MSELARVERCKGGKAEGEGRGYTARHEICYVVNQEWDTNRGNLLHPFR